MNDSNKLWVFKLMTMFNYSEHTAIHRTGIYDLIVQTNELCTSCNINAARFRDYLHELQDLGLILHVDWKQGYVIVQLKPIIGDKS